MRLLTLIGADLRSSWEILWRWYVGAAAMFAIMALMFQLQASSLGHQAVAFSAGDYLVSFWAGIKQYTLMDGEPFRFPAAWALAVLVGLCLTLGYPVRSAGGMGILTTVACGSRGRWWLAKCTWTLIALALYGLVAVSVAVLAAVVSGGTPGFTIHEELPTILGFRPSQTAPGPYDPLPFFAALALVGVGLALVQLALAMAFAAPVAFGCNVAALFLSAFYCSPWLVGNYLMAARSSVFMTGGMELWQALLAALFLGVASIVCGGLWFARKDLLAKGRKLWQ